MEVAITGPDDGDAIQLGPIRMRILEDGSTTSHRLGLGEITIAPHTDGPPQHRHARHDEGFYVVSGTARFTVGETVHDAPAGTLVMIPKYDPDEVVRGLAEHRVSIFAGGPAPIYIGLLRSPLFDQVDLSALKYCPSGGAPCPAFPPRKGRFFGSPGGSPPSHRSAQRR